MRSGPAARRRWNSSLGLLAAAAAGAGLLAWSGSSHQATVTQAAEPAQTVHQASVAAAQVYTNHCAACHGDTGQGDGPAAYLVYPKPRDFTSGIYRFKSTPTGQPPSRADIQRIITSGVERTAMPAFGGTLTAAEIDGLTDYVLAFNQGSQSDQTPTPIEIPPAPEFTDQLVQQGKIVYTAAGCGACHGDTGRGDGPSAATLRDDNGYPLPAADFSTGVFKAGRQSTDLYRTIMVGVPGTPMPSYANSIHQLQLDQVDPGTDRIWALAAYIRSLEQKREEAGIRSGAALSVSNLADQKQLTDPLHAAWQKATPSVISVQPLWQRRHAARSLEVRAVRTADQLAIRISWTDPTVDTMAETVAAFSDAGAIMFSLTGSIPPLMMGASQPDGQGGVQPTQLVNIWQWKASRQLNAAEHRLHDVPHGEDGHMPADMYMFKRGERAAGPISEHDTTYITAWAAANPHADPALIDKPALESNAASFGSLTLQPADAQNLQSLGLWADGQWHVLITRSLQAGEGDVQLTPGARIPVAFAIWDGAAGDRNGTKLISGWHWLDIPAQP